VRGASLPNLLSSRCDCIPFASLLAVLLADAPRPL
jgi:hypothetical protein